MPDWMVKFLSGSERCLDIRDIETLNYLNSLEPLERDKYVNAVLSVFSSKTAKEASERAFYMSDPPEGKLSELALVVGAYKSLELYYQYQRFSKELIFPQELLNQLIEDAGITYVDPMRNFGN